MTNQIGTRIITIQIITRTTTTATETIDVTRIIIHLLKETMIITIDIPTITIIIGQITIKNQHLRSKKREKGESSES